MKRLSSKATFLAKKAFPIYWFGCCATAEVVLIFTMHHSNGMVILILGIPAIAAIIGYVMMKFFLFDLIDEVYDQGDVLLLRHQGQEFPLPLGNIKNINYSAMTNPAMMTLHLRQPCPWGNKIVFALRINWIPFTKSSDFNDLIDRIDQARIANHSPVTMNQA